MQSSSSFDWIRPLLTLVAILGTFAVNVLSNFYPLNGLNIGEISNTLFADVLITPANYAFAIWGVIYLGLIGFGIYQLLPAQRRNPLLRRVDYALMVACVAQAIWVYLFLSRLFWLSVVAMLGILLPLIYIYRSLDPQRQRLPRSDKWLVQVPLSIYFGWITVATIVNVALALFNQGWNGWGFAPQGWTIILLIIAAAIAAVISVQRRDAAYVLVIAWALIAIAVRQANLLGVAITAIALAIGLVILLFLVNIASFKNIFSKS